jgi:hypothetical protein
LILDYYRQMLEFGTFHVVMRFLFPLQIQRVSYFVRMLACILLCFLLGVLIAWIGHVHPQWLLNPAWKLMWIFKIAWYAYVVCFVVAPRLFDVGLPRIFALLAIIPGINFGFGLLALFAPTGWWLRFHAKRS